jgi:pyruvate ferredoxin oxidoreductase beta subunit
MTSQDKIQKKESPLAPGHRTCAGCPAPMIAREVLEAVGSPVVVAAATGCLEVATTIYPETSWRVPFIHSAFENVAATISGVEAAYNAFLRKGDSMGKLNLKKDFKFIAIGGDGGTYDIGLQSLSGALERGHDFLYICYNNEGYMNTGGQRSGATTKGSGTTTTPFGEKSSGKIQFRKNLMEIVAAHNIPYCAQASIFDRLDLKRKVEKALSLKGPKFINVLSPCPTVWKFPPAELKTVLKLALDSRFWPIYEIENGKYRINYRPQEAAHLEDFLKTQGRFSHLFKNQSGMRVIEELKRRIDLEWGAIESRN